MTQPFAPWKVLAEDKLRTDEEGERQAATGEAGHVVFGEWRKNKSERKMSAAPEEVAKEVGVANISAVAVAYVMHKTPCLPDHGWAQLEHLMANIEALKISLTDEHIKDLESIPSRPGLPEHHYRLSSTSLPFGD